MRRMVKCAMARLAGEIHECTGGLKRSPRITASGVKLIFENRRDYGESEYPFTSV